ncbi:26166_t:CDS:2 [Racocetra persica]|uniref:26166_t:CDS:1 n=1 Tax=Racocetra persica TaxID=160502 RepID=A0ACA9KMF6_9GLOM|nr:26166_t:CDS:2 [Racocetra persica]
MEILFVNNIDAPSEHPDGGICINMNITNASQISVELSNIPFDIKYMNQNYCFSNDRNTLSFNGCLLPPNTREELDAMTNAFSKFLTGEELHLIFDAEASSRAWNFKFDPNEQYLPKLSLHYEITYSNLFPLGVYKFSYSFGIMESSFTTKPKIFSEDSKYLFGEIAKKLFTAEDVVLTVKGELNVIAKTPVGNIELKNISFNFDKNFKGVATMTNLSNVEIDFNGNVEFDLISDQNINIAKMTIENFKLKRGNEDMNVKINYLPDNDHGYKLIENYLNRRSKFKTLLPGIKALLIDEIEVSLRTKDSFMLHNPLKTKLYLFGFNSKVINMFNKQIATGITEPSVDGIVIESGLSRKIRIENTNMDVGNAIRNIKDCVNGVKESIECVLMFGIGENQDNLFRINLNYAQQDINVIWDLGFFKF